MASPVTFGIELEFNIAYLLQHEVLQDPTETRQVYFPITAEATEAIRQESEERFGGPTPPDMLWHIEQLKHTASMVNAVRDTLMSIGCTVDTRGLGTPFAWEILEDISVSETKGTTYHWYPMEVNSPALPFTPASLDIVARVCLSLTETYLTDPNCTTGVHVHLSAGTTAFDYRTMQKLYAFLWSFEHQLSSLHPETRQNNRFCLGLREQSTMVDRFTKEWGEAPSILQGVVEFYKCDNIERLLELANELLNGRYLNFSCYNALLGLQFPGQGSKPTIEARQHEGSLDGERVVNWIKLLAGLVQRLETIHPESFRELLQLTDLETWEKGDDERVNKLNQVNLGPIPAESTLTIIDILEYLDLHESADYYRNRLFKIRGRDRRSQLPSFSWNDLAHQKSRHPKTSRDDLEDEETRMMKSFQSLMIARAATNQEYGGELNFNPDDRMWSMISRIDGKEA